MRSCCSFSLGTQVQQPKHFEVRSHLPSTVSIRSTSKAISVSCCEKVVQLLALYVVRSFNKLVQTVVRTLNGPPPNKQPGCATSPMVYHVIAIYSLPWFPPLESFWGETTGINPTQQYDGASFSETEQLRDNGDEFSIKPIQRQYLPPNTSHLHDIRYSILQETMAAVTTV